MELFNKVHIHWNSSRIGMQLLIAVILCYSVLMGVYFRTRSTSSLEGQFVLGPDSYRHMRHIQQIVETGYLPEIDRMRYVPFGYRNTLHSKTFPWLIVQGYKILHLLTPKVTPYQVAIFSPVVMSVLITVLFFFLTKRLFDCFIALLATPALVSLPWFIGRTAVGYVDTDAIILFLFLFAAYFYILSFSRSFYQQAVNKLACSLILGILGLVWPGVSIAAGVLYGCDFLAILYRGTYWKNALVSLLGILLYLGCLLIPTEIYRENILDSFALSAIAPALLAMVGHAVILLRCTRYGRWFGTGSVAFIVLAILLLIFFKREVLEKLLMQILYTFGTDPIMTGISELQHFEISDWWRQYGLFFLFGLFGFWFLIYENWCAVKKDLKSPNIHLMCLTIGIFAMVLARAFTSFFSERSLAISTLFLILPTVWVMLHAAYVLTLKPDGYYSLMVSVWFLVSFNLACSAVRFNLFLAPVLSLTSSVLLVKAFEFLVPDARKSSWIYPLLSISLIGWQLLLTDSDMLTLLLQSVSLSNLNFHLSPRTKLLMTFIPSLIFLGVLLNGFIPHSFRVFHKYLKFCGVLTILFLSWLAYTGAYGWGIGQKGFATGSLQKPGPNPGVQEAIKWLKQNTPSNAVVAADWDYGSTINQLGERATIIDEEQNLPTIRAFYQQVVCGESSEVALDFLKRHRVTHLMLTLRELSAGLDDIYKSAHPDIKSDPFLMIHLKPIIQDGESNHQEFLPINRFFLPQIDVSNPSHNFPEALEVLKMTVDYIVTDGFRDVSRPPQVLLKSQTSQKDLGIREFISNYQQWYFPEAELSGTFWVNDFVEAYGPFFHVHNLSAFFFSDLARNLLITRLFLDNSESPFKLVFNGAGGAVRIWEIK